MHSIPHNYLKIQPNCLVEYVLRENYTSNGNLIERRLPVNRHDLKKERSHVKGQLSHHAIRRLRAAINLLVAISPRQKQYYLGSETEWYWYRLGFLTLTLPAPQVHCDATIKREVLMPYLQTLKRKFGLKSYVWKAEKQQNGNLHFHLTINKFILYTELRRLWNKHLERLGYISVYQGAMRIWHKDGFHVREDLLPIWSEEKQREAYKRGVKLDWTDPNTTDIHGVKNIRNLSAYMVKYMIKKDLEGHFVCGKIWDCSTNLKSKLKCVIELWRECEQEWKYLQISNKKDMRYEDYYTMLFTSPEKIEDKLTGKLLAHYKNYLQQIKQL